MAVVYLRPLDRDDSDDSDDPGNRVVPDGGRVRVPAMFMDHGIPPEEILPSRRGLYGGSGISDELKRAFNDQDAVDHDACSRAYNARTERISNAWRKPPPSPPTSREQQHRDECDDDPTRISAEDRAARVADAIEQRRLRLQNAWRNPA